MHNSSAVEGAISRLANTMRIYVEENMRFARLYDVDREEAINNMDLAFEEKLEAFHTLYDVSKALFPYFDYGDTTLLIAVRNAVHHRSHPLFRSLLSQLFLEDDSSRERIASFLIATYPMGPGPRIIAGHYIRLDDLDARLNPSLNSPYLDATLKHDRAEQRFRLLEHQLSLETIRREGAKGRYPRSNVYLDLVPVFTSAVCRVFKAMKTMGIRFKGFDAEVYMEPFTTEIEVHLNTPTFQTLLFSGHAGDRDQGATLPN